MIEHSHTKETSETKKARFIERASRVWRKRKKTELATQEKEDELREVIASH